MVKFLSLYQDDIHKNTTARRTRKTPLLKFIKQHVDKKWYLHVQMQTLLRQHSNWITSTL